MKSIFKASFILLLCFIFAPGCQDSKVHDLKKLSLKINNLDVPLHNKNYLGDPGDENLVYVSEALVDLEIIGDIDGFDNKLKLIINNVERMAHFPNRTVSLKDWDEQGRSKIKLCVDEACLTAYVALDSEMPEMEEEYTDGLMASTPTVPAINRGNQNGSLKSDSDGPSTGGKRTNNFNSDSRPNKGDDNVQRQKDVKQDKDTDNETDTDTEEDNPIVSNDNPIAEEPKKNPPTEEKEFLRYGTAGYMASKHRCKDEFFGSQGAAVLELRPQRDLELVSFKVIAESNATVDVKITGADNTINIREVKRQLIGGQPSEINFQHRNLILEKGKVYVVELLPGISDLSFESMASCNASMPGSDILSLIPGPNGNIFLEVKYKY